MINSRFTRKPQKDQNPNEMKFMNGKGCTPDNYHYDITPGLLSPDKTQNQTRLPLDNLSRYSGGCPEANIIILCRDWLTKGVETQGVHNCPTRLCPGKVILWGVVLSIE